MDQMTPSHVQVPTQILNLWGKLEGQCDAALSDIGSVLAELHQIRQQLEDAAVQQKLASDRLGEEQIARILTENKYAEPNIIQCVAAVEQAARAVLDHCWDPRGYADIITGDLMKALRLSIVQLDLARKHARDIATAGPGPV